MIARLFSNLPAECFVEQGTMAPNRKGLALVGAYLNSVGRRKYGRPLVIAASADLADSTNISGFAKDFGGLDVLSSTPPRPKTRKLDWHRRLADLATKPHEYFGPGLNRRPRFRSRISEIRYELRFSFSPRAQTR